MTAQLADSGWEEGSDAAPHIAVVGGGVSGLAAALRLLGAEGESAGVRPRVTVFEAAVRPGGVVRTVELAGRAVDLGADSLVTRSPGLMELVDEIGLSDRLIQPAHGSTAVWSRGRARELPLGITTGMPQGFGPLIRSGLLSPAGIVRAGLDLVLPRTDPGDVGDSAGELIRRRFGDEVLDRVIDPLLGGINHTRCDELSLEVGAPGFAAAARTHRSLIRGLRAQAGGARPDADGLGSRFSTSARAAFAWIRGSRRSQSPAKADAPGSPTRQASPAKAAPPPMFVAPRGGMAELIDAMAAEVIARGGEIRCSEPVRTVAAGTVTLARGSETSADAAAPTDATTPADSTASAETAPSTSSADDEPPIKLSGPEGDVSISVDGTVLALRPGTAGEVLAEGAPRTAAGLEELPQASILQVILIYPPEAERALPPGNGMLIPRPEGGLVRAATWVTRKWPDRGGDGSMIVRCSIAPEEIDEQFQSAHKSSDGRPDPAGSVPQAHGAEQEVEHERIAAAVHADLARRLGSLPEPTGHRVELLSDALSVARPGHADRIRAVQSDLAAELPAVHLAGPHVGGSGIGACIASAYAAADAAPLSLRRR